MPTDYTDKIETITRQIEERFTEKRRIHTYGVRDTAIKLASKYGGDPVKAEVAALYHDLFRGTPVETVNRYVVDLGLDRDRYFDQVNLAHGKIAAILMETEYGIREPEILNAVSYHTTGRAGMTLLEKILYLADGIEPSRDYPGVEALREVAEIDLDKACLQALEGSIAHVKSEGGYLDEDSVAAAEDLRKRIAAKTVEEI